MFNAAAAYVRDPLRCFALVCWGGAFALTVLLIVLASEAVADAQRAQAQIENIRADQMEQYVAERKRGR